MHTHPLTDITIIGGGPTGLFALFYAGMRGASARTIDKMMDVARESRANGISIGCCWVA